MSSIQQWLQQTIRVLQDATISAAAREAHTILAEVLQRDSAWIIAHADETLADPAQQQRLDEIVQRRRQREPLALILGRREFYGRSFSIGAGVLVPRPETEHLIEWVLEHHMHTPYSRGIDLCTGSGIIGITLALECRIPFHVLDVSAQALQWARENIFRQSLQNIITAHAADVLHDDLARFGKFSLLTANPPYIALDEANRLMPEITRYEPPEALYGGAQTGLEFTLQMLANSRSLAAKNADFFIELGANHHKLLKSNQSYHGWRLLDWKCDLAGIPRISHWKYTG